MTCRDDIAWLRDVKVHSQRMRCRAVPHGAARWRKAPIRQRIHTGRVAACVALHCSAARRRTVPRGTASGVNERLHRICSDDTHTRCSFKCQNQKR